MHTAKLANCPYAFMEPHCTVPLKSKNSQKEHSAVLAVGMRLWILKPLSVLKEGAKIVTWVGVHGMHVHYVYIVYLCQFCF